VGHKGAKEGVEAKGAKAVVEEDEVEKAQVEAEEATMATPIRHTA
jgi:hypothetical protein